MRANMDIRNYAKKQEVFLHEAATALNISEPTMTRWLRTELSADRKAEIISAIDTVAAQHAQNAATK